ncbi:glycosyltransferase 87 family protein [Tunturiibacter gelidiferens]|uniref:glycosyltransferase 87 family protein n=1 Tax=Tunturiibacter gelidiferens TaxID=3069689 RepID=UPI003D9B3A85
MLTLLATHMALRTLPKAWDTLNTDFPNYYLTASLVHEGYDTSRVYEWPWLQRQKDHRDIDQRLVGMVPITPFSTLIIYPLTSLPVLTAKRCWLILNLGLLVATLSILRRLTRHPWRHLSLVAALSFPLRVNFLFGQYYVLLLFLLTLACWLYICQKRFLAGIAVGFATGLKVFPAFYLLYFLRKRDLKAFAGGVLGSVSTGVASIYAFGWELNRTYIFQVLPSALRGEGLDPYNLQAASLSSLLHKLFIYEPQLNQHPAFSAPSLFAILHPLLQMMLMAPALLLATPNETCPRRVQLEWAAILLASLAISTSPASYLFTLLILPASLIWEALQQEKRGWWVAILLPLYVIAGFVGGTNNGAEGWIALLTVPRLHAMILLCVFSYVVLVRQESSKSTKRDRLAWSLALAAILTFSIVFNLRHQRGLYADYQQRIPIPKEVFMAVHPTVEEDGILFVAMQHDGYHSAVERFGAVHFSKGHDDELGIAAANGNRWVEQTGNESKIISASDGRISIQQAESPVASSNGRWLAFLREDHGRTRIWTRALDQPAAIDMPLTPSEFNVLEMSFAPGGGIVFSAASGVGNQDYLWQIESEVSDLSIWARPDILLSHQTATGSLIANCKVEIGIFGCAICATAKLAGLPMQHATTPNLPGPRTRKR